MTVFIRLMIVLALNLLCVRVVWADVCNNPIEPTLQGKDISSIVTLKEGITSHPLGEEVSLVVPTVSISKPGVGLITCIRWQPRLGNDEKQEWIGNLPLRVIKSELNETIVNVRLPEREQFKNQDLAGFWELSTAEIRFIVIDSATSTLDTVLPIHIISAGFSLFVAIISCIIFWLLCFAIAKSRNIQGHGATGFMLKIIVNQYGYASLSQFQIMLWTFVVGGSAVYVMVLTGRLINIEDTMLYLLGGAGVVSTLTAMKATGANPDTAKAQQVTQTEETPVHSGGVVDLQVCGKQGDTQVVLAWKSPVTGGIPDYYEVQYLVSGTVPPVWTTIINSAIESPVTVSGLTTGTTYDFQVCAVNAAGRGVGKTLERIEMASVTDITAPAQVQGVSTTPKQNSIMVSWNALSSVSDSYVLRYREAETGLWIIGGIVNGSQTSFEIRKLWPNTIYEIEVNAVTSGKKGEASVVTSQRTVSRQPEFADLLMGQDSKEIDVSRIQMLFFTLIAAAFVMVKVLSSHEIPEIPNGILLLMGISNGVYLTAKFIPQKG